VPGGDPFPILISVDITGQTSAPFTCTISYNLTVNDPASIYNSTFCTPNPSGQGASCSITPDGTPSSQTIVLANGDINLLNGCAGAVFGPHCACSIGQNVTGDFIITSNVEVLGVQLLPDATILADNNTINYTVSHTFQMTGRVTNTGACAATNVTCVLEIPTPFVSDNETGLAFLNGSAPGSTLIQDGCTKVFDTVLCPADYTNMTSYINLNAGQSHDIVMEFTQTGNGVFNFSMQCTVAGQAGTAYTNLTLIGSGVPPPTQPVGSSVGDGGHDLIRDTAIPLAIFGCVMITFWSIAIILIVVYCVVSHVGGGGGGDGL